MNKIASEKLTVYYDGSCPLCRAEINHYRKRDGGLRLDLCDVSNDAAQLPEDLGRDAAMARFHVRRPDGQLVSGAAAFTELWAAVPGWRRIAPAARLPVIRHGLELGYRMFLPVRPLLSRAFGALAGRRKNSGADGAA